MKAIQIKKHQVAAIEAIKNAVNNKQPKITIEMATGTGTSLILAKVLEYLLEIDKKKVLIITGSISIKEQLNSWIFEHYKDLINIDKRMVEIKNIQYVYKNPNVINDTYHFIITYDIPQSNRCYEILYKSQKTIINFQKYKKKLFPTNDIVFTYSHQDAIKDGIFSPAMNPKLYDIAAESFCKRLLEKFNCKTINDIESVNEAFWDFRFSNEGKTIYVQHKNFKSEDISPNEINTVLKNILWHKSQHKIPQEDITLLILFGNAFGIDRKVLYEKFKIIVWDISNLVFYTQNDESLARELSQLTYFPIEEIAGEPAEAWNFTTISSPDTVEDLSIIADEHINKLKGCKTGQANSREYEEICEDIVRYLFSDAFYYMSSQHRTEDNHFRMDLICSFKGINEKTHAFWQLLAQHYNTRFIVFEFKNYSATIDQNLIYITEKYLFMEMYSFGKKYTPSDVLSDLSDDNPDILMKFLFFIDKIFTLYSNGNYGSVISTCKRQIKYFNASSLNLQPHNDKKSLKEKFDFLKAIYDDEESSVKNLIDGFEQLGILKEDFTNKLYENSEYTNVFDISFVQIKNLSAYLNNPYISTQHGVKGESHTSVIFVSNDSNNNPNVRMYSFFELWSKLDFSLPEFEDFYYSFVHIITELESKIGLKINDLTKDTYAGCSDTLKQYCEFILEKYNDNKIFESIYQKDFLVFNSKPNVTNARKVFKVSKVEGILTAYKLFYVGCSRARKNLLIYVDETKISNFKKEFIEKVEAIGFSVGDTL